MLQLCIVNSLTPSTSPLPDHWEQPANTKMFKAWYLTNKSYHHLQGFLMVSPYEFGLRTSPRNSAAEAPGCVWTIGKRRWTLGREKRYRSLIKEPKNLANLQLSKLKSPAFEDHTFFFGILVLNSRSARPQLNQCLSRGAVAREASSWLFIKQFMTSPCCFVTLINRDHAENHGFEKSDKKCIIWRWS